MPGEEDYTDTFHKMAVDQHIYLIAFSLLQPLHVELFAGVQFPCGLHLTGRHFAKSPFSQYTEIQKPVLAHGLHLQPLPLQKPFQVHTLQEESIGYLLEKVHHIVHDLTEKIIPGLMMFLFDICDAIFWQEGAEMLGARFHVAGHDLDCFLDSIIILSHVVFFNILPQAARAFILTDGVQELLEETFADGLLHAYRLEAQVQSLPQAFAHRDVRQLETGVVLFVSVGCRVGSAIQAAAG